MGKLSSLFVASMLCAVGCQGQFNGKAQGSAAYSRPVADGGKQVAPQQNSADLQLTISIDGSGLWDLVQGVACTLTSGGISGSAEASGEIRSDGSYVSLFSTAQGNFNSPLDPLCDSLEDVKFQQVTSL